MKAGMEDMTDAEHGHAHDADIPEDLRKLAAELRVLAAAALEQFEPILRRAASGDQQEWNGCSWCPVCAALALLRGEHHDLLAILAEHGVSIVTVLREAVAGTPVEPLIPDSGEPARPSGYQDIPVTIKV